MMNSEAMFHSTKTSKSYLLTGPFTQNKEFYDQVRSDFLQQSAKYLRESLSRGRSVSIT